METHRKKKNCGVAVTMEGYNGHAWLGQLIRQRGYRLYNLNNLKLARFKEIFSGAAKNDRIDAPRSWSWFS
ncbi:MAG TPA: hypothetical protein VF089_01030 [Candidatus Binatia bacterium]